VHSRNPGRETTFKQTTNGRREVTFKPYTQVKVTDVDQY